MALWHPFKPKTGWKRPRKRENKNYRSASFLPDAKSKITNKKNTIMASFLAKKSRKMMRTRENKNYHYVSFQPDEQ